MSAQRFFDGFRTSQEMSKGSSQEREGFSCASAQVVEKVAEHKDTAHLATKARVHC